MKAAVEWDGEAIPFIDRYEIYEGDGDDEQLSCQGTWHTVTKE